MGPLEVSTANCLDDAFTASENIVNPPCKDGSIRKLVSHSIYVTKMDVIKVDVTKV